MEIIRDVVIGVIGGLIVLFFQWGWRKLQEERGIFTGTWEQLIYKDDTHSELVKKDIVTCRQNGRRVKANIKREFPDKQSHREWYFSGRYTRGTLFGHFWSKNEGIPSFGTIFLRQTEDCFKGFYVRYHQIVDTWAKDTVRIDQIPLEWHKID